MSDNCELCDMLKFRENKVKIQRHLLKNSKESGCCVISFGLNIPGPIKTGEIFRYAFNEGQHCIEELLKEKQWKILDKMSMAEIAGYAMIYLVKADAICLKNEAVYIEDHHALGRLFDIDIIVDNGKAISREEVGATVRKCLICTENAKICARSRRHSIEELNNKVISIIEAWRNRDDSRRQSI